MSDEIEEGELNSDPENDSKLKRNATTAHQTSPQADEDNPYEEEDVKKKILISIKKL